MSADNYFITDQNAVYFLTFSVTDWIDVFTRKDYKMEIVNPTVSFTPAKFEKHVELLLNQADQKY